MSGPAMETLLWAAHRVVAQHTEPVAGHVDPPIPRCGQCQPDGSCRLLAWAVVILRPPPTT